MQGTKTQIMESLNTNMSQYAKETEYKQKRSIRFKANLNEQFKESTKDRYNNRNQQILSNKKEIEEDLSKSIYNRKMQEYTKNQEAL